jgi:molybdenum cofactor synthesis domain-containing protein
VLSLDAARAHVLERVAPLPPRRLPVPEAAGLVLAEAVAAPADVPPFANTAMDGYAVRAADVAGATAAAPVQLPVVAEVAAGHPAPRPLQAGEAMRIFTGAPVPEGADAIVIVERTQRLDGGAAVAVEEEVEPGRHVRAAGDDLRAGDAVFAAGDVLTPGHLGVLAGIGATEVLVHPRPRVGVLSTGDELVPPGQPLGPGQIYDSNRLTLLALVAEAGGEPVDLGLVADDEAAIEATIRRGAATCDLVLSSGGVSMGDIDLVKAVLDRIGDMQWMQIAIKPAKPFALGTVDGTPVLGLPGNPVSSMVSFELLARPALRTLAGHLEVLRPTTTVAAAEDLRRRPDGKLHLVRVRLGPDGARSAGGQGSHHLTAMARAHGLALLPDGDGVSAGEPVEVLILGP